MKKVVSLQRQLIKSSVFSSIGAGILAFGVFLVLSVYNTMQIHDEIMDEVADMLLMSDITRQAGRHIDEISEEFSIQYVLKAENFVFVHSTPFDFSPITPPHAYALLWQHGQLWRSYSINENGMQAQIYQPLWMRVQDLAQPLAWFVGILNLLWLLQWLLVRFAIQRQFNSLQLLSQGIQKKHAQDLTPISAPQIEFLELQPLLNQLNQLLGRLDQSLHAEQRFTADASHELRSPLSAIQMRLQVLKRKYQDQVQLAQDLQPIQNDVTRSIQTLENLLLLARLDPSQADSLPKQACNLHEISIEVLETLLPWIEEKNLVLQLTLHEFWIEGHRELLYSALRNVLDNAVRYSPVGGTIDMVMNVAQKTLSISNQGDVLEAEVLARLGERFYRVLGTQSTGSGLGISICKKIMHLHAADIHFIARPQGGLTAQMHWS
jgi:two-component system, OmpR family, sensor histidine kinase QseC